jgi:hypothetical protein
LLENKIKPQEVIKEAAELSVEEDKEIESQETKKEEKEVIEENNNRNGSQSPSSADLLN